MEKAEKTDLLLVGYRCQTDEEVKRGQINPNTLIKETTMNMKANKRTLIVPVVALLLSVAFVGNSFAAEKVPDSAINRYVKDALYDDARVDASEITTTTNKGIVTLSGKVDSIVAKKYADLETKKINGVLGVINKINVDPTWRLDTDIRNAVRRRILNSAVIESEGLKVASSGGKVTLSGTVSAWNERQEVVLLAGEVRGVKEVVDNITVKWTTKRSDQAIKNDAVAKIARDVYLESLPIMVDVKNGVVTISGKVGSAYEKDRTRNAIFRLSHVKGLQNDLKVDYSEDYGTREKRAAPSDSDLKDTVSKELQVDSRVSASDIAVKVSHGLVTLSGAVYSHKEKQIARQDAKDVIGVIRVSNKLFTRVDKRMDSAVRDDVEFNLSTDVTTAGFDINVKAKDGIVTLSGAVNIWYEKSHAGDVASRIKGVRDVINQISVDYYHSAIVKMHSTAQVIKEIKNGLKANWSTKWVSDDISVSVKDGIATLTGKVNSWHQRSEAADVAYTTKGVWEVKNKLAVEGYGYDWDDYDYHSPYNLW